MPDDTSVAESAVKREPALPVSVEQRIPSVDVLRGVALLGILVINIEFFAFPSTIFLHPEAVGGFTGLNLWTFHFASDLFLMKMMAIFSMLFGAGLVLMYDRAESAGRKLGWVYYRRIFWLLVLALIHSYLIWYGDILFSYAMTGLLLFLFRRCRPRTLIIWGCVFLLLGVLIQVGSGIQFSMLREAAIEVEQAEAEGRTPTRYQEAMAEAWEEASEFLDPSDSTMQEEIENYRGSYSHNLEHRVDETILMQTQSFAFFVFWRVCGLMLIGMAMMRLNVFSAERSSKFYIIMGALGYVVGLPMVIAGTNGLIASGFDITQRFKIPGLLNYIGSVFVALGHVSVVMLICKAGLWTRLRHGLAAVGRMALTNYLMQSIICTTIFYGYGLGLFAKVERFDLLWFVLGVWILQLVYSPWWLKRFRYGPAEWLWRSLTYWKRQPMRI